MSPKVVATDYDLNFNIIRESESCNSSRSGVSPKTQNYFTECKALCDINAASPNRQFQTELNKQAKMYQ